MKIISSEEKYLTPEELADKLKMSKFTVYALIKRGELPFFRMGRKLLLPASQLDRIMEEGLKTRQPKNLGNDGGNINEFEARSTSIKADPASPAIICGQDPLLDLIVHELRNRSGSFNFLRNHLNSMQGLLELYQRRAAATAIHLWDADLDEYNIPYARHVLPGYAFSIYNLVYRVEGFYVASGNPKKINCIQDLSKRVRLANREIGSGARVLLDESMRLVKIDRRSVVGYDSISTTHAMAASKVASGECDVAIGIDGVAKQMEGIDFVPLKIERYDLVILADALAEELKEIPEILASDNMKSNLKNMGYDVIDTGKLLFRQG